MARAGGADRGLFERPKGSDIWWIRYADARGRERREVGGTKAQARSLYQHRKREVWLGRHRPDLAAARSPALFGEIAGDALAYARLRHASLKTTECRMKRLSGWWRELPALDLTPQEIEARLGPAISTGSTFNRYRALLSLVYRLAQTHGKVPPGFNPARSVQARREPKRVRWLSADEERRLRQVLRREYPHRPWAALLDLALNCGLRWGDQAKLTAASRDGDRVQLETGKTAEPLSFRLNPIALRAWRALEAEAAWTGAESLSPVRSPRHWFRRALKLAKISDFRWHDLRHTFATRLLEAGVPAEKVQQLLGHRSIVMTLRYAHLVEGYHDDALGRLAEINRRCARGGARVTPIAKAKEAREVRRRLKRLGISRGT